MRKREIKTELKRIINDRNLNNWYDQYDDFNDADYESFYLGSYLSLDPCGRYHHVISPNGITARCERFWNNLEESAEELGCWIESGEGDALDIYLCRSKRQATNS